MYSTFVSVGSDSRGDLVEYQLEAGPSDRLGMWRHVQVQPATD